MSTEKKIRSLEETKFSSLVDLNRPKTYITLGAKGAGKSEVNEKNACDLHNAGWLGLDLWGVMGESFFWAINFNHEKEHQLKLSSNPSLKGQKHCGCRRTYPILVLAPDSIKFNQISLDKFNGYAVKSKNDWLEYSQKNSFYPIEWDHRWIGQRLKDLNFKNKPLIKITYLPEPSANTSNHDKFIEQFTNALLDARKDNRICVFNPQIWTHEASRFKAVELMVRSLEQIKYDHFEPASQDIKIEINNRYQERGYITHEEARQYNQDKIYILIRELGELTASQLKAYENSTSSKRGILAYIRRARHNGITSLWDLQNPEDCFSSIRNQADTFFIKRANPRLLGNDWAWLYKEIEAKRDWISKTYSYGYYGKIEADKRYPRIEDLPVNYLYVVEDNGSFRLKKIGTPEFHHKQQSEHFGQMTGITWENVSAITTKIIQVESLVDQPKEISMTSTDRVQLIKQMVEPKELGGKDLTFSKAYDAIMKMVDEGKIPRQSWRNSNSMLKWFKRNQAHKSETS